MVTIFNRKELLMTSDMQKQGAVRRMLVENGINYAVDVVNLWVPSPFSAGRRMNSGKQDENPAIQNQYTIYVKKSDYNEACGLMHRRLRDVF